MGWLLRGYGVNIPPFIINNNNLQSAEERCAVSHVSGDLFSCPEEEALAHCISEDCRMGAGIAVLFRKKFHGVEELKAQSESRPYKTFIT